MFGTAQLRSTFHLPSLAPRVPDASSRQATAPAPMTAGLLRRIEDTLTAEAAAARVDPLAGIDLARPLSLSLAPASGVLRLEFSACAAGGDPAPVEALARHLAPLLALQGVTRVEARVVEPRTGALLDARSLEAPADA